MLGHKIVETGLLQVARDVLRKTTAGGRESFGVKSRGSYQIAYLTDDQYIMQKLKGNI